MEDKSGFKSVMKRLCYWNANLDVVTAYEIPCLWNMPSESSFSPKLCVCVCVCVHAHVLLFDKHFNECQSWFVST